ncbi:SDR family oxidoreductase [Novosphingobium malaysiense]|uniref:Short-chain dehydrogenase n=1 Tax=Novosphingobium malaysiense TaxID=1348853 RepID=A0A0B1ZT88_9SPHN|nr:SDR family oxidoreductase [Novosphingobium malaysiense]KHK92659.1 short-chain dehydrogenase [Novosphingobium malaysiense]
MGKLDGKVALITGGSNGLGAADARMLASEGAQVVITDIQDELGEATAASIEGALYLHHDVRDEAQWRSVVDTVIERYGRLDILVNNAGLVIFGNVVDQSFADYKMHVDVMLDGTFLGCKTAIPHIARAGGGTIVNMSSVGGIKGVGAIPAYAAAKGGIIAMTKSIAVYCQEQGFNIRVNAIAPGAIETPMTAKAVAQLPKEEAGLAQLQNHGMGKPDDIANTVLFLVGDSGRHITGTTITVDNGETAR